MMRALYGPYVYDVEDDRLWAAESPTATPLGPTILVVDDDADVRRATRRVLESYGYDVIEANDGVEAVDIFRACAGRIALVLTDVVMWRMGGADLSACLTTLYPGTRLVFMSGYREERLRKQGLVPHGGTFVAKPFEADLLAWTVRRMLGG